MDLQQEELVKQALASTKDKSSLEGLTRGRASVDVDVDALSSLIDDLRSESSRGSFSRAWMQVCSIYIVLDAGVFQLLPVQPTCIQDNKVLSAQVR